MAFRQGAITLVAFQVLSDRYYRGPLFSKEKMFNKIRRLLYSPFEKKYDFDKSNPLGGGGERVDFTYHPQLKTSKLDVYQINHYRRYEFACKQINSGDVCGDFACGSGYGSAMLSQKAQKVIGIDIDQKVITAIQQRYAHLGHLEYHCKNLLDLGFDNQFDNIISFETLEHFEEEEIKKILNLFSRALKKGGKIIFSTPYMQADDEAARNLGFHKTFYINEDKIKSWLPNAGLENLSFSYQNYQTHEIKSKLRQTDFIICVAQF